jgi:hypothetical protein
MEKIQEIELTIKSADDGVFAISLVDQPAIEENFVALAAQDVEFKVVDEERRIVVGFALVPEKRILRLMGGKKFNIYFTKETVAQAAEDFMKKMMLKKFTTDHEEKVDGITVIESWVVEDAKHDKSNLYGLGAKGGEWVLMSKIDNNEVWDEVKAGKFKGYSIEARFDGFEQLQSKNKETMEEQIIKELNAVLSSQKVELSLIDDVVSLQKMVKERITLLDKATIEINKTVDLKDKLISLAKTTLTVINSNSNEVNILLKQITQAEGDLFKIARELNLNVREIPEMKLLLELKNEMTNKVKNELSGKTKLVEDIIK